MSYYENRIKALEAKVAEMAQNERFKAIPVEAKLIDRIVELNKENASLKAEVERLRASSFVTAVPVEQYERVIKAGDALAGNLPYIADSHLSDEVWVDMQAAWNAAKGGKPSV